MGPGQTCFYSSKEQIHNMKKIFAVLLLFIGYQAVSQTFLPPRSSATTTVQDSRWRALLTMYYPHTHGLTLNGGLDTLGAVIYDDSSAHVWVRDTVLIGGHKWSMILKSGDAGQGTLTQLNTGLGLLGGPVTTTGTLIVDTSYGANGLSHFFIRIKDSTVAFVTPTQMNAQGFLKTVNGIALGGDMTGSTLPNPVIAANAVTFAKFQTIPGQTFVANPTASPAVTQASYFKYGLIWNNDSLKVDTATLKAVFAGGTVVGGINQLTGDGTAGPGTGSQPLTLATVNANVGSFGTASSVAVFTTNAKGLTTAAAAVAIQIGEGQVTNLTTDLANKLSSALASGAIFVGNGSNLAAAVTASGDWTITNAGVATLKNTGIGAGSCTNCNITFDAQGREVSYAPGSGGTGGTNSNVGSGYRFALPNTNNIKTLFVVGGTLDSTTNANGLTLTVAGASIPPNIGSGFRIYSPQVPGFRSLVAGTNITIDSTANANSLTINSSGGSGIVQVFGKNSVTQLGTDTLTLVGDKPLPGRGYFYGARPAIDSAKGFYELAENSLGTIYNVNSWASTAGFTNGGVTVAITANKFAFSGGAGTYTYLALNYFTCLDKFFIQDSVVVQEKSGTSFGHGIGVHSVNNGSGSSNSDLLCRFIGFTGFSTSGTIQIDAGSGHTDVGNSAPITWNTGDTLVESLSRDGYLVTATVRNLTQNGPTQSVSYVFQTFPNIGPFMPNTAQFAIYSLGGSFTVNNLFIKSKEDVNARLMLTGDSRFDGYSQSNQSNRAPDRMNAIDKSTVASAGGFNRTIDALKTLPQDSALRPQQDIIWLDINDVLTGVNNATIEANLDSIYHYYTINKIDAYFFLGQTTKIGIKDSITVIHTYIKTNHPGRYIDGDNIAKISGALDVDSIHYTDVGMNYIIEAIVNSGKLYAANSVSGSASQFISNQVSTPQMGGLNIIGVASTVFAPLSVGNSVSGITQFSIKGDANAGIINYGFLEGMNTFARTLDGSLAGVPWSIGGNALSLGYYSGGGFGQEIRIDSLGTILGDSIINRVQVTFNNSHIFKIRWFASSAQGGYNGIESSNFGRDTLKGLAIRASYLDINNTVSGALAAARFDRSGNLILGDTTDVPTALLAMKSTTKGFLPPVLNTTQQNAISSPASGLVIFNSDSSGLVDYNGTAWLKERGASGGGAQTLAATQLATTINIAISGGNNQNLALANATHAGLVDSARWFFLDSLYRGLKVFNLFAGSGLTAAGGDSINFGGTLNQSTTLAFGGFGLKLTGLTSSNSAVNILGRATDSSVVSVPMTGGTWTPTVTTGTNVSAGSGNSSTYTRIGNIVTFAGSVNATLTLAATQSVVNISLPVSSTFTASNDANGVIGSNVALALSPQNLIANTSSGNTMIINFSSGASTGGYILYFSGQYLVH